MCFLSHKGCKNQPLNLVSLRVTQEFKRVGWSGLEWVGVGWSGLEWVGVAWSGLEWIGVAWSGLEWVGAQFDKAP